MAKTFYNEGLSDREILLSSKEVSNVVGFPIKHFHLTGNGKFYTVRYFLYNIFKKDVMEKIIESFNHLQNTDPEYHLQYYYNIYNLINKEKNCDQKT